MTVWVHFWDMHSGGGQKLEWANIFIEAADEKDAARYFEERFGRDPSNVTCSCCGEDYSVSVEPSLKQATGYQRGCPCTETKRDPETGLYRNDDPLSGLYLDAGEEPPPGYSVSKLSSWRNRDNPLSVADYAKCPEVLIVRLGER